LTELLADSERRLDSVFRKMEEVCAAKVAEREAQCEAARKKAEESLREEIQAKIDEIEVLQLAQRTAERRIETMKANGDRERIRAGKDYMDMAPTGGAAKKRRRQVL
jgi:hypothetical protein